MARLFISQDRIDVWTTQNKVHIEGDRMGLPMFGTTFRLVPAVYFLRILPEGADPNDLVGRVKTEAQLRQLGAELVANSVLLGDVAYDCDNGFIGEVIEKGAIGAGPGRDWRNSDIHRLDDITGEVVVDAASNSSDAPIDVPGDAPGDAPGARSAGGGAHKR